MGDRAMRHHIQWAAQFAVASELCKRGYDVSFTMGNTTPDADLMVLSPQKKMFLVDVKGQQTKNFWRIKEKKPQQGLFYVLTYVSLKEANRYFILTQEDLRKLMKKYENSGVKFDRRFSGINWKAPFPNENKWGLLPR
jgi:hypothetical protein